MFLNCMCVCVCVCVYVCLCVCVNVTDFVSFFIKIGLLVCNRRSLLIEYNEKFEVKLCGISDMDICCFYDIMFIINPYQKHAHMFVFVKSGDIP